MPPSSDLPAPVDGSPGGSSEMFRALHEVAVAVSGVLEPAALAGLVVHHARALLGADAAHLYVWDEREVVLRAVAGTDPSGLGPAGPVHPGEGAVGRAFERREPVVEGDYATSPDARRASVSGGVRAAAATPLLVGDHAIGVLAARFRDVRTFAANPSTILTLLAAQVAPALEAARLHEAERTARHEADSLHQAALDIGGEWDLAGRLERVLDAALDLTGGEQADVALVNDDGQEIAVVAARGGAGEPIRRMPARQGLAGRVLANNSPLRAADLAADSRTWRPDLAGGWRIRSWLGAPLADVVGPFGVLSVQHSEPNAFTEADERKLGALAALAASAVREARLREQAERAASARDTFAASAAHDLKVPLAAIKGLAQVASRLVDRLDSTEARQVAEALARIDAASGRMAAMLDGLLDATRLEAGQTLDLDLQPTDLGALAEEVVAEQQRVTTRHRIVLDAGEEVLVGAWDAARLERVLGNLLGNAVKYSPEGGDVAVRLARAQDEGGDWAVLEVQDHGVGIPAADLPHVFERYRRGGNVEGRIAGSGIGLAGACQIVQQHGGTISAESGGEARGATLTVRLPLTAGSRSQQEETASAPPP